jgi:hypothetical protein
MARYGHFQFNTKQPVATCEGDFMKLDDKGYVCIFRGDPGVFDICNPSRLTAVFYLEKGQSVREVDADLQ